MMKPRRSYSVESAPALIRGLTVVYGFSVAALIWLFLFVYRLTLRVQVLGDRETRIEALWHENLLFYFLVFNKSRRESVWMQHPALYMKPIHLLLNWRGVKHLAYGSSGNDGKSALDQVIGGLNEGKMTVITPDGPAGPPLTLKRGVVLLAEQTGLPVTAISFQAQWCVRLPTWDKKRIPLPFSAVTVHFHEPLVWMSAEGFGQRLAAQLSMNDE